MARRKKSGPKKKDGPREKNGRSSRRISHQLVDRGTQQSQDKRQYLINGADPQLAATASGILFENGLLTEEQHSAALRYAWAHALVFGKPWRQACPLVEKGEGSSPLPDELLEVARHKLERMDRQLTLDQRLQVANVSVSGQLPHWWIAQKCKLRQMPEDGAERQALLSGLDAIVGL